MAETTLSNQIFLSRDQTRLQIIEYLKTYLEVENVDLTKSSFLSFIVNVLSTLTSNLLFYETSVYKEFFLTTAQLPDSILNLSSFLGYSSSDATYAETDLLMRVPLKFTDNYIKFVIPKNFKFYAGNIEFTTYYRTEVIVSNNNSATVVIQEEDRIYNIPVNVDTTTNLDFSFLLPVRQYKQTSQEFQVDSDLKSYQFFTIDVPVKGKVQSMIVFIRDPGGTEDKIYKQFSSLYLMSSTDYGYVSRKTAKGRRLFFGNGLIGIQPLPGSTITALINETEGLDGNVIAGSVKRGDRIYYTPPSSAQTKIIDYTVTNASGAMGGTEEEDLEETRSNAIISLTSLNRLVSELDYKNANYIVPFSALALNPIAVLKRSDVKTNEIQLYMPLVYNDSLVPTRNEKISVSYGTTFLPRGTIITDSVLMEYTTLFDITLDYINSIANFHYIMYQITQALTLVSSYGSSYVMSAGEVNISKSGLTATFEVPYFTTEIDYATTSCIMEFLETDETFTMTNDSINKKFTYTFADYTNIPEGNLTLAFTINHMLSQVATYSTTVVFRKDLKDIMMSNIKIDGTSVIIFDIPVVEVSYYNMVDKKEFESYVLQNMMAGMETYKYRMLTDFTNVKYVNTYGQMQNMKYNKVTKPAVKDILNDPPSSPSLGDRYIVGETFSFDWIGQKNNIAQYSDATANIWTFFEPKTNETVFVEVYNDKYLFTGQNWVLPRFTCPIQIKAEVFKKEIYVGSDTELTAKIKNALIQVFRPRFGPNAAIYRSQIVRVVQSIEGVDHCQLIFPTSDVFFNFDIMTDLTQEQLLEYSPEYVYFTISDISLKII